MLQHRPGAGDAAVYGILCALHHYSRSHRADRSVPDIPAGVFVDNFLNAMSLIGRRVQLTSTDLAASAMLAETRPRASKEKQMADPPPYPGPPRWLKVFGIIAVVL
ncbi:MAG: hypothetical protein ACREJ0_20680, partial [Geminicoccaceae bacterium]